MKSSVLAPNPTNNFSYDIGVTVGSNKKDFGAWRTSSGENGLSSAF